MNRRDFGRSLSTTAIAACAVPSIVFPFPPTPDPNRSDPPEAIRLSVMLWTVFNELPFEQRLEKVAEAGYRNVQLVGEYQNWSEQDFERAEAKRKELNLTFDATAGLKPSLTNPADRAALVADFRNHLSTMEKISCPSMIVLSGNIVPQMSRDAQHQSCIDGLKALAAAIEGKSIHGQPIRILLETIDPEENPKYFLTQIGEALEVVQSVAHPQVQLLYDFYHQQIAGGNLIRNLQKCMPNLALAHIADVPGRHEPGTGEIDYPNIFRKLGELNYQGSVAMEFHPTGDAVTQLRTARHMALEEYALGKARSSAGKGTIN